MKTGGYEAEYGQSTGGVVNVITKSGIEHAAAAALFGYFRPTGLESDVQPGHDGQRHGQHHRHARRRRGRRSRRTDHPEPRVLLRRDRSAVARPHVYVAPEGFPLRSLGDVDQDRRIVAYAAKGTWQIAPASASTCHSSAIRRAATTGRSATRRCCGTDTSAFSKLDNTAVTTKPCRYEGAISRSWLLEASFARAKNSIVEMPSVDQWSVTDNTVTPQMPERRHRLLRSRQQRRELAVSGEGHQRHRQPPDPLWRRVREHRLHQHDKPHRADVHAARRYADGDRRGDGDRRRIRRYGQIYRVIRANTSNVRDTTQHYVNFFVAGHVEGRPPADDQSRRPLRAPGAHRHAGGLDARQQLGAAHRRHLRSHGPWHDEDLRQLGAILLEDPQRSGGARTVG